MKRNEKIMGVALMAAAFTMCGDALAAPNALEGMGDVRLNGYLGQRLNTMLERHVIGMDVDYITAPFLEKTETKNWWQTEFWGKYMHSAVPFWQATGCARLKARIDDGVENEILLDGILQADAEKRWVRL